MKLPSIRKGCMHCGAPLHTMKEKLLRTCVNCAAGAREGFDLMGQGKFKEGYGQVKDVMYGKNIDEKTIKKKKLTDELVSTVISKKESKLIKKLKKKGLTDQEIKEGLDQFKKIQNGQENNNKI